MSASELEKLNAKYRGCLIKKSFKYFGEYTGEIAEVWLKKKDNVIYARALYQDGDAEDIPIDEIDTYVSGTKNNVTGKSPTDTNDSIEPDTAVSVENSTQPEAEQKEAAPNVIDAIEQTELVPEGNVETSHKIQADLEPPKDSTAVKTTPASNVQEDKKELTAGGIGEKKSELKDTKLPAHGTVYRHAQEASIKNTSFKAVNILARRHNSSTKRKKEEHPDKTLAEIHEIILEPLKQMGNYMKTLSLVQSCFRGVLPEHAEDTGRLLLSKIKRDKKRVLEEVGHAQERKRRRHQFLGPEDTKKNKKEMEADDLWAEYESTIITYQKSCRRRLLRGGTLDAMFKENFEEDWLDQLKKINKLKKLSQPIKRIVEEDMNSADKLVESLHRLEKEQAAENFDDLFEDEEVMKEEIPTSEDAKKDKEDIEAQQKENTAKQKDLSNSKDGMVSFQKSVHKTVNAITEAWEKKEKRIQTAYVKHQNHSKTFQNTDGARHSYHHARIQEMYTAYNKIQEAAKLTGEIGRKILNEQCPALTVKMDSLKELYAKRAELLEQEVKLAECIMKISCKWHPNQKKDEKEAPATAAAAAPEPAPPAETETANPPETSPAQPEEAKTENVKSTSQISNLEVAREEVQAMEQMEAHGDIFEDVEYEEVQADNEVDQEMPCRAGDRIEHFQLEQALKESAVQASEQPLPVSPEQKENSQVSNQNKETDTDGLNEESVRKVMKLYNGRICPKDLLGEFKKQLKDKPAKARFKALVQKLTNVVDDAVEGRMLVLKPVYMIMHK